MPDLSTVTDAATRKLGPLPVWGWGLLAGGGVVIWRRLHPRPVEAAPGDTVGTGQAPPEGVNYSPVMTSGYNPPGATGAPVTTSPDGGPYNPDLQTLADSIYALTEAVYGGGGPSATPTTYAPEPAPAPAPSTPPPTPGPPENRYPVGTVVGPGETIISAVYSPEFGWLDETSKGGVYTGGGGTRSIGSLPFGGSYLGYAGTQPNVAQELATHGQFAPGSLTLVPGGYREVNSRGEVYTFT